MKAAEATNQSRCAAKMESDSGFGGKRHYLRTITGAIPFVFSVASVAFCILLGIQTSEIKTRMLDLESSNGERPMHPFAEVSIDEFNSMVQERVDEVLSQVNHFNLFKSVYVNVAFHYFTQCIHLLTFANQPTQRLVNICFGFCSFRSAPTNILHV